MMALAAARAMIGVRMRTEQYVRQASLDTMLNFVNGIGDANPLFRDQEYAAYSKYGSVVGHPCAPYMRHWSGRTRWGLPGVHGFFAGNDWEFFRVLRPGDAVNCVERVLDVQEKQSAYSGRLVIQYVETTYSNQRDEVVARVVGWCTRHQRRALPRAGASTPTSPSATSTPRTSWPPLMSRCCAKRPAAASPAIGRTPKSVRNCPP